MVKKTFIDRMFRWSIFREAFFFHFFHFLHFFLGGAGGKPRLPTWKTRDVIQGVTYVVFAPRARVQRGLSFIRGWRRLCFRDGSKKERSDSCHVSVGNPWMIRDAVQRRGRHFFAMVFVVPWMTSPMFFFSFFLIGRGRKQKNEFSGC